MMLRSPTILLLLSLMAGCTLYEAQPPIPTNVIAFHTNDLSTTFNYQLYLIQPNGKGLHALTHSAFKSASTPRWSPDGTELVYEVHGENVNSHAGSVLYTMRADGSHPQRLSDRLGLPKELAPGGTASWSPDGRYIAATYCGFCTANHDGDIFIADLEAKQVQIILNQERDDYRVSAWKPGGGALLYYSRTIRSSPYFLPRHLYLYDQFTEQTRRITTEEAPASSLGSWSPDGAFIAYVAQDTTVLRYEVATGLHTVIPVTTPDTLRAGLKWSPTGAYLAYTDFRRWVYVVDAVDGRLVHQLDLRSVFPVPDGDAFLGLSLQDWSPEGDALLLLYSARLQGSRDDYNYLLVWRFDEQGVTRLFTGKQEPVLGRWSPR